MGGITVTTVRPDSPDADHAMRVRAECGAMNGGDTTALRREIADDPAGLIVLARDASGTPVASGDLGPIRSRHEPHGRWLGIWTLPGMRGRGFGRRVWDAIDAHASARGLSLLRTHVYADEPDALAFLGRRGFRQVERDQFVRLDLAEGPPPSAPVPDGIRLTSLAEEPHLLDRLRDAEREVAADVPGDGESAWRAPGADEWRDRLATGLFRPWAVVMALDGDQVAGFAHLEFDAPGAAAWHELTAVRRPWRGRGVALAIKAELAARAAAHGIPALLATNALDNAPMRAVNERLGYRRGPDCIGLRQDRPVAP